MKIPKYIQEAIKRAGKATQVNHENSEIVRQWLVNKGLINKNGENLTNENVIDYLIDSIEMGRNGSIGLIDYIKELKNKEG